MASEICLPSLFLPIYSSSQGQRGHASMEVVYVEPAAAAAAAAATAAAAAAAAISDVCTLRTTDYNLGPLSM